VNRSHQKVTLGLALSGTVLLGQLLYAQSAARDSYAHSVPLMRLTTQLDSDLAQARIALERAMVGDNTISVQVQVNEVLANCESLTSIATTGGSTALGKILATENAEQLRRFSQLGAEIAKLNSLATARWNSKARYQPGGAAETEFEQQYSVIRKLLKESHDFLGEDLTGSQARAARALNLALVSVVGILGFVFFWEIRSGTRSLELTQELETQRQDAQLTHWILNGETALSQAFRGDLDYGEVSRQLISVLAQHLGCQVGVFYRRKQEIFELSASYAFTHRRNLETTFKEGEGLLGQAALERQPIVLTQVPPDFLQIESGLGAALPANLVVFPLVRGKTVVAVLEFASFQAIEPYKVEFLKKINDYAALALEASEQRAQTTELIQQGQSQADQLKLRQAELRAADDHVHELGLNLQEADSSLRAKSAELEAQQAELAQALLLLEESKKSLDSKASELNRTEAYQADFVAQLSQEVRRPLNSILALSKKLSDNPWNNLNGKQLEFSQAIQDSGDELQQLLEQVLGSSGTVEEDTVEIPAPQASMLDLLGEPTRPRRGDAFKQSETLSGTYPTGSGEEPSNPGRSDAFEQSQTLSRTYPTGSGEEPSNPGRSDTFEQGETLSGTYSAVSGQSGRSDTFEQGETLSGTYSAVSGQSGRSDTFEQGETLSGTYPAVSGAVSGGVPPTLLIVEDDVVFSKVLSRIAEAEGYRPVVLHSGASCLSIAKNSKPAAIILDVELPDTTGWELLRLLRSDMETQSIPVHFISSQQPGQDLSETGAQGYSVKPVSRSVLHDTLRGLFPSSAEAGFMTSTETRTILLIESDAHLIQSLRSYLEKPYLRVETATTSQAAKQKLTELKVDCIVLDLNLGENSAETGLQMLEWLQHLRQPTEIPVLVHTGTDITSELEAQILATADRLVLPGSSSYERLKDEVELFLYQVNKPNQKAPAVQERPPGMDGKTILVVEDDIDELLALTQVLEEKGIRVIQATDGLEALEELSSSNNIDMVLMDVLLPRMDGIEATRRIRANPDCKYIPVIALTAQAMAGDRLRFLKAGASDYLTKPIDLARLFSMIRIWTTSAQARKSAKQAHLAP
jgi:CheY-like chemotaxis protein